MEKFEELDKLLDDFKELICKDSDKLMKIIQLIISHINMAIEREEIDENTKKYLGKIASIISSHIFYILPGINFNIKSKNMIEFSPNDQVSYIITRWIFDIMSDFLKDEILPKYE